MARAKVTRLACALALKAGFIASTASCSESNGTSESLPPPPLPPSDAAAPWVGTYVCTNTLTTTLKATGSTAMAVTMDDLWVTASGNTLTGLVLQDSGLIAGCDYLVATVAGGRGEPSTFELERKAFVGRRRRARRMLATPVVERVA